MQKKVGLFILFSLASVGGYAAHLDVGLSGGSYVWGNATWERTLHQSVTDTGQFDVGAFAEYGDRISGRIELRYNHDYGSGSYSGRFDNGFVSGQENFSQNENFDEWMLPILVKFNQPISEHLRGNLFLGPEVCLYRTGTFSSSGSVQVDPPNSAFSSTYSQKSFAVEPWQPENSLGALIGGGVDYDFGSLSLGVKLNLEFVRLTQDGDFNDAIDHRYNVQMDLGYKLF